MFNCFSRRASRRWLYPLISLSVVLGLCLGQPIAAKAISWGDLILRGIQVVQLSSMSDQQELELGRQINAELTGGQVRLNRDPELNNYVNQIGQRLAAQGPRPKIPYTFQVVQDNSVNAFATMGGFVYVNTGLLKLADNEAQLASVIGHEIGHIAARHAVKQMKETAIAQGVLGATGLSRSTAVNIGVELALLRPNSRNDEFQSDQLGVQMMGRAGYAQAAAADFMTKLLRQRSTPTFLSRHPATSDRVARLRQQVNPAQASGSGLDNTAYRSRLRSI
ncbi:M48 family metalloprotease [Leptolyngbya sp. FACHB-36]|uniref:M48 family metallopeptidase n=1 Tax=Leptolyngbya sp. FACHB-36 TaxID=2692808 RepID=UPI001681A70D|nr:M48 family metallopeptidase [Leptolyngbya sp. FACHB-36]MBD2019423.1 M48 family metalloprotease [Leptolyngbya sp. FACHB-36]